jgi:hypothetical protein
MPAIGFVQSEMRSRRVTRRSRMEDFESDVETHKLNKTQLYSPFLDQLKPLFQSRWKLSPNPESGDRITVSRVDCHPPPHLLSWILLRLRFLFYVFFEPCFSRQICVIFFSFQDFDRSFRRTIWASQWNIFRLTNGFLKCSVFYWVSLFIPKNVHLFIKVQMPCRTRSIFHQNLSHSQKECPFHTHYEFTIKDNDIL